MKTQEETIEYLQDLLTRNYDAEAGYKLAAEKSENASLKGYLESRAQNRYDYGHAIKEEIKKLGGEPKKGTSLLADAHRVWISLRDALTSGDQAIYDEAVRGEEAFITEYEEALEHKNALPQSVIDMITKQHDEAKTAIKDLKVLEGYAQN